MECGGRGIPSLPVIPLAAVRFHSHIAAMQHEQRIEGVGNLDASRIKIIEGTARRVLLTARYNGQLLSLAPHALFARHGELFVRALNLSKKWRIGEERRLGDFKVAGLVGVEVTQQPFEVFPSSEPLLSKPDDDLVLAVT